MEQSQASLLFAQVEWQEGGQGLGRLCALPINLFKTAAQPTKMTPAEGTCVSGMLLSDVGSM